MKKIIFLLLFVVVSLQSAFSQTFAYNGRNYEVTSSTTVRVGSNGGATGTVSIPAQVTYNSSTYNVTEIKTSAFLGSSGLTSVILPNSITVIGENSFYNCPFLTSITLSTSLTTISRNSFSECIRLSSVTIPNSVTTIGDYAFNNCSSLTSLIIPNSVTSTGISAFNNCSGLTSVIIPNSLTLIKDNSFSGCTSLTSVTIPNSVTSIGFAAFDTCVSLTSLTIGNSVTSIGAAAFNNCRNLTSIICNVATPLSAGSVFGGTNPLIRSNCSLKVPASSVAAYQQATIWKNFNPISCITTSNNTTISACGSYTWANNNQTYSASGTYTGTTTNCVTEMLNLTITPSTTNTTTISACNSYTWANNGLSYSTSGTYTGSTTNCVTEVLNLTITTQPTNFTSGGINYVVTSPTTVAVGSNVSASGNIVIPASVTTDCGVYPVTSIGDNAFRMNGSITSISMPNTITSIGNNAFQYCSGITSVVIPNSVISIGNDCFANNTNLTSATIPDSVTSIGSAAFGTTGLTSITIPNSVSIIKSFTFGYCNNLTSVTIPNSVTKISAAAFYSCIGLTSVTIPNSVTSIEGSAFAGCSGLTSVICNIATPLSIEANVFGGVNQGSCRLTVPDASVTAYQAATVWQDFNPINCLYLTGTVFTSGGINYVFNSPTTVAVGSNGGASGSIIIPTSVTTECGTYSVTSIGDSAFAGSSELTSITIPDTVTSIGNSAFVHCTNLNSITIPNSVSFIGMTAFAYCTSLTSVTIPNSIYRLNNGLFRRCNQLTTVTIPSSVNEIGYEVFRDCTSLTSLICNNIYPVSVNATTFEGVNQGACSLIVPNSSAAAAYQAAPFWQYFAPITCLNITENTISISACGSYTWANNSQIYTTSGIYTGLTTNCVTEILNLTITPSTNNTTNVTSCGSYTWSNNGQTYSTSGTYTGTTTNCVTEILNLTINAVPSIPTIPNLIVLDQQAGVSTGFSGTINQYQTFTAGVSGKLEKISIELGNPNGDQSATTLTVQVYNGEGTSGTLLGTQTYTYPAQWGWQYVDFNFTDVSVVQGQQYTFKLITPSQIYAYLGVSNDSYSGGYLNFSTSADISFKTYVIKNINFCEGATTGNLNAVGTNVKWYNSAVGLNQLTNSELLVSGTYYVSQSTETCESERATVNVTITPNTNNTTTISACNSYTWANNNQTYTTSGTYTGTTTNCVTEVLNLTITTPPTTFIVGGLKYVLTSPTTVAVGLNPTANGSIIIPATVTTDCGTYTVTSIGHSAFYSCSGLTSVTIPNTVSFIDKYAFEGCTSLTSVIIPNSVTTINDFAFLACNSLTSITIPNSLNRINKAVFKECSSLTSVTIPNSVTSIGESAFQFCSGLTTVTIPSSVTSIGINAFNNCTSLTSVISNKTTPLLINANVFGGVNQPACSLTVPDSSVAAYQAAAVWKLFAPIYCANQTVNTTTISVCDTYTWANNGQTYLVSGIYRGSTSNCITEMLNLTITPSTTNTTTISACDSYNWSVNGQNYTSGGTYTSVSGCHTETLVLTITPSSDNATSITSCGSYTWANNGQTYSTSGTYRGRTTNCVTEVLNLTINALPSAPSLSLVDQHCDNITGYLGLKNQTQTFKAGASGRLDKISMYLGNPNGNASASILTVQVYEGLGTNGTLLGSKEYAYPAQWGFQNVDFNFTDISVVQNQQYTFKLSTSSVSQGFVGINTENTYSGGSLDFAPSSDMIFKTYVVRANQTFCQGATVNNLESDGTNIIWYNAATGGNQINTNELLATGTYFVAQNDDNSCQSPRTLVNVLVNPTTAITSQPVASYICAAVGSTSTFSVASNAVNSSYTWQYKVAATTSNTNPDWITITSANAAVYANFNTPTLNVTKTAQLPSAGTQYRVLVSGTCGNATSVTVPLTILSTVRGGSISTSASSVCIGSDIILTVAGYAGTSFQWQSSATANGEFVNIQGATGTTYTVAGVTSTTDKSYRVIVTNSCNNTTATSATKTIVVNPTSVAGIVTGGGIICSSGSGTLKVAGHTGSIQWEYSTNGNDYVNAPKATDAQTIPFGTTSSNSTSSTYLVTGISTNLYFRAKITSGACSSVYTTPVQYTITTVAVGTISEASTSLCTGTGTSLSLTEATGVITWQKNTNLASPSWSAIANATGLSIETGNLTSSTAYRAMVTLNGCSASYSNVANVSVVATPLAKTIIANTTNPTGTTTNKAICTNSTVAKTLTVGSAYVGTIQWQKSTTSNAIGFEDIANQTGTSYTVSNPAVGANYFRAKFTNTCGASVYGNVITLYYKNCGTISKIIEKSDKEIAEFKVIASPNPYSENFNLNITTSRVENVEVSIYDMTGKLIDKHEVRPNDATTLEFGTNYPTGVYNVMVTQGIETKTLRVIKK